MSVDPQHLGGDRWRIRVYDAGRKRQVGEVFRARTKRDAKAKAPAIEAKLRQQIKEARSARGTVAGAVDEWRKVKDPRASPTTIYRREPILRAIKEGLGHHLLVDLSPRHVDVWLNELRAENVSQSTDPKKARYRSEATIGHYYRQLAAVLNLFIKYGDISRLATRGAGKPAVARNELAIPSATTLHTVIDGAPLPLRTIAKFAAHTGMRRGEICGLRWSDLSADGTLRIERAVSEVPGQPLTTKKPKTGQTRSLPLGDATLALLEQHRVWVAAQAEACGATVAPDGPMFPEVRPDRGVTLMSPGALSSAWRSHCRRLGVSIRFHDLRHWNASALLNDGQPLHAVSHRLGHSLPSTTQNIYGHREQSGDREIARRIGELLP